MDVGRIFSRGEATWGFFQNLSRGGQKVVKFFYHSKLRKQHFFAETFEIQTDTIEKHNDKRDQLP